MNLWPKMKAKLARNSCKCIYTRGAQFTNLIFFIYYYSTQNCTATHYMSLGGFPWLCAGLGPKKSDQHVRFSSIGLKVGVDCCIFNLSFTGDPNKVQYLRVLAVEVNLFTHTAIWHHAHCNFSCSLLHTRWQEKQKIHYIWSRLQVYFLLLSSFSI